MAENLFPEIVVNVTTGADAATGINATGNDSEISFRRISSLANVSEITYYKTGTIIYAEAENSFYQYSGTAWVVWYSIPTSKTIYAEVGENTTLDETYGTVDVSAPCTINLGNPVTSTWEYRIHAVTACTIDSIEGELYSMNPGQTINVYSTGTIWRF